MFPLLSALLLSPRRLEGSPAPSTRHRQPPLPGSQPPWRRPCGDEMESKHDDDDDGGVPGSKDDAGVAPALRLVARYFAAKRAACADAAECDGIECLYGDWLSENADEFDDFVDDCGGSGEGNSHYVKALHEEFLALFEKDVEAALDDSKFTLDQFMGDVQLARDDGLSERWESLEMATGAWFVEALWAALDIAEFSKVMADAAGRQRRAMDRKRAMRVLRRGAK